MRPAAGGGHRLTISFVKKTPPHGDDGVKWCRAGNLQKQSRDGPAQIVSTAHLVSITQKALERGALREGATQLLSRRGQSGNIAIFVIGVLAGAIIVGVATFVLWGIAREREQTFN